MRPPAFVHRHLNHKIENPRHTLVADRRGYIFRRDNLNPRAELEPMHMRRLPVSGTLKLGIKAFKRENRDARGKVHQMYKQHAWGEVEKGITNHIKAQDEAKAKPKPRRKKKTAKK